MKSIHHEFEIPQLSDNFELKYKIPRRRAFNALVSPNWGGAEQSPRLTLPWDDDNAETMSQPREASMSICTIYLRAEQTLIKYHNEMCDQHGLLIGIISFMFNT